MKELMIGLVALFIIEGIFCPIRDIIIAFRYPKTEFKSEKEDE